MFISNGNRCTETLCHNKINIYAIFNIRYLYYTYKITKYEVTYLRLHELSQILS